MTAFFGICDYLGVTPQAFFDIQAPDPVRLSALLSAAKGLSGEQLDHLIAIVDGLKR